MTEKDTGTNKIMAVLCYLGFLWLVPLLTDYKNDPFVKFHINQGIILTVLGALVWLIGYIPLIGGFISWVGGLAVFILAIIGIINSINMEEKPLPIIGTLFVAYK